MASNNELMRFVEERIGSNNQLQNFVEKAKAVTIPLFPETVTFTQPEYKMGAALVTVDLKLDSYGNNKDIYKNESGGYCLHLSKINEIAQQAGLQVVDSRMLERRVDDQGRVTYISHQVTWKMKSIDGSVKEGVATGKYDYFNDLATKKEGQVKSRRKHAEALAESNALTRAYNKAIAKLPQSFTLDELKKPFLVPFVIEDKNELLKDLPPEVQADLKKQVAMKRLGLMDAIYAPPAKQVEDASFTEVQTAKAISAPLPEKGLSKEEENHITAEEFRESPQKERTEKILRLIKLKDFKSDKPVTAAQIDKAPLDQQIMFIEKLLNLPDADDQDGGLPL